MKNKTQKHNNTKNCADAEASSACIVSQPNYQIACYKCGNIGDLVMAAHRNDNKNIVGWVFACNECFPELAGKNLEIRLAG